MTRLVTVGDRAHGAHCSCNSAIYKDNGEEQKEPSVDIQRGILEKDTALQESSGALLLL